MKFFNQFSVKYLFESLDYWIMIGIDSDIYECKTQRLEYQHYVAEAEQIGLYGRDISLYTLKKLETESKLPFFKQKTFYILLKLFFKKLLRII